MSERLIADLKLAEGLRLTAYQDTLGYWTVGYGHKLPVNQPWTGYTITKEEAEMLLVGDVGEKIKECAVLPEILGLNECRHNAVVELVFNMGLHTWLKFEHARAALRVQDWDRAADELLDSTWARQVGELRSLRLASYFRRGVYA